MAAGGIAWSSRGSPVTHTASDVCPQWGINQSWEVMSIEKLEEGQESGPVLAVLSQGG